METSQIIERLRSCHDITTLTPMQQAMAHTEARRIILLSPTGSGKTAAFTLRLLRVLGTSHGEVQAVIMAPARELVLQIAGVIRPVAQGLKTVALYGGHAMADEVRSLTPIPDIIVATPGRLLDHLQRGSLDISTAQALVLDEYDKSLELGFEEEMRKIVRRLGDLRLTILTSATPLAEKMPKYLEMKGAEIFDYTAGGARTRLQTVRVPSPQADKLETLAELLRQLPDGRALVFVNHRESADRVYAYLRREGFPAGLYHGGLEQQQREMAIDMFNNGSTPILVSTDLASRGLDIEDVNYVIHYHLPLTAESWTHRNGRTARMGASGTAYSIIAEEENIPEWVVWERELRPGREASEPIRAHYATLYFNAGKKEKISRGDIAGFLMKAGGMEAGEVGKIELYDHYAIAAVSIEKATPALIESLNAQRVKGTRVRVSMVKS